MKILSRMVLVLATVMLTVMTLPKGTIVSHAKTLTIVTVEEAMKDLEAKAEAKEQLYGEWCVDEIKWMIDRIYGEGTSWAYASLNACDYAYVSDERFDFIPYNGDLSRFRRGDFLVYSYSSAAWFGGINCGHISIVSSVDCVNNTITTFDQHFNHPYVEKITQTLPISWGTIAGVLRPNWKVATTNETKTNFMDIPSDEWYTKSVTWASKKKIMNGTGGNAFSPMMTLTRGQFVTILYNMENRPEIKFEGKFSDVKSSEFYALPVEWAAKQGITSGTGGNAFSPNDRITREQMVTMLYNYAVYKNMSRKSSSETLNNFSDRTKISNWGKNAVIWAVTNRVIDGKKTNDGQNILDPQGQASRAECAQMMYNYYNSIVALANSASDTGIGLANAFLSIDTNKRYMLIPKSKPDMALNVYVDDPSYIADYTNICLWSRIMEDQAQWYNLKRQDADTYLIRTSNQSYTVNYVPSNKNIIAYSDRAENNEAFRFEKIDGCYAIRLQSDPTLCMAHTNENNVILELYTGSENQLWNLISE